MTIFLVFSEFQGEKIQVKRAGFVTNRKLYSKTIEKCLLRARNFSNEVFIYITRNFSSFINLYWSQGLHRHNAYNRYQHFPKMSILCSIFETKCDMKELEDGLNQLLLSTMQLTSAQVKYCESSKAARIQLHPSLLNSRAGSSGMQVSGCLESLKNKNKNKTKSLLLFWDGLPKRAAVEKFECWPLTKWHHEFPVHTNTNYSHHWDENNSWS